MFKTITKDSDYVDVNEDALINFVAYLLEVHKDKVQVDFDVHFNGGREAGEITLTVNQLDIPTYAYQNLENALDTQFQDDDDVFDYEITTNEKGFYMVIIRFNDPIYNPNDEVWG